ncbi:MAG: AraC family transcriptional regulator [Prolixibacteraceae bacterium]
MKKEDGFPGQISYVLPGKILNLVRENPLTSDLYLTDIGYYPHARNHFRERPAGCAQSILIYCVDGKGKIRLNNGNHEVQADEYLIIPAGTPHSYHSDMKNPWSIYWIHFTGKKSAAFVRHAGIPMQVERNKFSRTNERLSLFNDIFRNLDRGFGIEILEYVNQILGFLLASFTHLHQFQELRKADENDHVALSINFMLENLDKKLRLNEIAEAAELSISHYSKLFQTRTGHSPIDYFTQLKVQRACRLLDNSGWMIADVARESGFDDQFYFSRVFRKVMGLSPAEYRKRKV